MQHDERPFVTVFELASRRGRGPVIAAVLAEGPDPEARGSGVTPSPSGKMAGSSRREQGSSRRCAADNTRRIWPAPSPRRAGAATRAAKPEKHAARSSGPESRSRLPVPAPESAGQRRATAWQRRGRRAAVPPGRASGRRTGRAWPPDLIVDTTTAALTGAGWPARRTGKRRDQPSRPLAGPGRFFGMMAGVQACAECFRKMAATGAKRGRRRSGKHASAAGSRFFAVVFGRSGGRPMAPPP